MNDDDDVRASTPGPRSGRKPMAGSPGMIGWKGARLQIATEIFAGMAVGCTFAKSNPHSEVMRGARRFALEQAEQLLLDNEEMP